AAFLGRDRFFKQFDRWLQGRGQAAAVGTNQQVPLDTLVAIGAGRKRAPRQDVEDAIAVHDRSPESCPVERPPPAAPRSAPSGASFRNISANRSSPLRTRFLAVGRLQCMASAISWNFNSPKKRNRRASACTSLSRPSNCSSNSRRSLANSRPKGAGSPLG